MRALLKSVKDQFLIIQTITFFLDNVHYQEIDFVIFFIGLKV